MIWVTGDTHGDWIHRLNMDSFPFPEQKDMTKDDYVIILGDFGIWSNNNQQKYNLKWLEEKILQLFLLMAIMKIMIYLRLIR